MSSEASERAFDERGFDRAVIRRQLAGLRDANQQVQSEEPETMSWIERHLEKVNLGTLQDIFSAMARKSGVPEKEIVDIRSIPVFVAPNSSTLHVHEFFMGFFPDSNAIVMDASLIRKDLVDSKDASAATWMFLASLIHEYTHAVGANILSKVGNEEFFQTGFKKRTVGKRHTDTGTPRTANHLFNEGMTELVARMVMEEYLRREPMRVDDREILHVSTIKPMMAGRGSMQLNATYEVALTFVERFARHIADASELPEDVLRDALIRGYFNGDGFSGEGGDIIDEVLGESFRVALAGAETSEDLARIANMYEFPPVTVSLKTAVLNFLARFRQS